MKKLFSITLGMIFMTFCLIDAWAQDEPKGQWLIIHEDMVEPAKLEAYKKAAKVFKDKAEEYQMDMESHAVMQDDYTFLYVTPVENMAALDTNPFAELAKKVGKEKVKEMFAGYEDTYTSHRNFMVWRSDDYSYVPEGSDWTPETLYRRWDYYYMDPDKGEEAKAVSKEWKNLYETKNVTNGYKIYTGGMGLEMPLYVVLTWGKDAADLEAKAAANMELLGEEADALWEKTQKLIRKSDRKEGWYLPDLSYIPQEATTGKE